MPEVPFARYAKRGGFASHSTAMKRVYAWRINDEALFELLLKRVYSLRTKPEGVNTQMKALDYVVMVCYQ